MQQLQGHKQHTESTNNNKNTESPNNNKESTSDAIESNEATVNQSTEAEPEDEDAPCNTSGQKKKTYGQRRGYGVVPKEQVPFHFSTEKLRKSKELIQNGKYVGIGDQFKVDREEVCYDIKLLRKGVLKLGQKGMVRIFHFSTV